MKAPRVVAVILAGGAGTRFWPLSREARPKPLLKAGGKKTLLAETVARARRIASKRDVWLVCGAEHAAAMRRAAGLAADRVLVEPCARNTAPAIALAAARIAAEDPEAVMTVLSADHSIPDAAAFAASVRQAAPAAAAGALVTIGVQPRRPETGLGYIRLGRLAGSRWPGLHRVARFVEKPSRLRAERYLARGGYLWNAGIFVWKAGSILEEIERCAPGLARATAEVRRAAQRGHGLAAALASSWPRLRAEP
ncbi:MAG: sugar phosphate nucleotidyltransferase, partial [Myxococcota bacterium]